MSDPNEIAGFAAAAETRRVNTEGSTMRISFSTRQPDAADLHIARVVFGAWIIVRTRSADQIEGWIDAGLRSLGPTDLDEIAAAIRLANR